MMMMSNQALHASSPQAADRKTAAVEADDAAVYKQTPYGRKRISTWRSKAMMALIVLVGVPAVVYRWLTRRR